MPNIKLIIEYDGSRFSGWQFQPGRRTIQDELTKALSIVLHEKILMVHASGRTDAGVHARAQVVSFRTEKTPDLKVLPYSVSSILKGEVAVISAEIVPDDFHPRRSATKKQYKYVILNRPAPPTYEEGSVLHVGGKLDLDRMQKEAALLVGEHDFKSFQGNYCQAVNSIKTIYESYFDVSMPYIVYKIVGSGFLKQMVRNIVGTLIQMGQGRFRDVDMSKILEMKDRRVAGVTAQPQGLFLDWVEYK